MIENSCERMPEPIIDGLHPDVKQLAGYRLTSPMRQNYFLLFQGDSPLQHGSSVMMKLPRNNEALSYERSQREVEFQSLASEVSPFVPQVVDYLPAVPLVIDEEKMARPANATTSRTEFPLFIMEKIPGRRLDDFVDENGPLSQNSLTQGLLPVALGIDAFGQQKKIVHRDIKPANILITPDGMGKVIDFDIAVSVGEKINKGKFAFGTPGYEPIEQLVAYSSLTHKTNVWGFGALMAFGITAAHLLPVNLEHFLPVISQKGIYESYLDGQLSHLTTPVQDVIRRATAYFTEDRQESCVDVFDEYMRASEQKQSTVIYQRAS